MIKLIKEINEVLEQAKATEIAEQATAVAIIESNLTGFDKSVALFETAEEFLAQLGAMVGAGKVDPAQVDRIASELATLQLLSQEDTKGAILSRFKGDPAQNLATILKGVGKPSDAPGKVDTMLMQVAQQNGKSLADTNKQTLSQIEQMTDQQKQQFAQTIQKLTGYFRQAAGAASQMPATPPAQGQTPAVAATSAQGTPAPQGGAAPAGI
jgi:hypothetical protein